MIYDPSKYNTQGPILGLLLFSVYINNMPLVCPEVHTQMYADDGVLMFMHRGNRKLLKH